MRRFGMMLMGLGLAVVLPGCGGSSTDEAIEVEPAEEPSTQVDTQVDADASADAGGGAEIEIDEPLFLPGGVAEKPSGASVAEIDASVPNAAHRIAGRSAFPEAGETITEPIPGKRLSEDDQFIEPVDEAKIPDVVPWEQANRYVGYEITVQGKIVDVGQSRDGKVNFLNFHEDWRGKFYLVMFDDLAKTLGKSPGAMFRGKTVRVTGMVEDHRGRPQVKVLSMDQVEFVGE